MWNKPREINPSLSCIVMDTEGLSSCNRDVNIDSKIFTLSVVLSSYFIYNCLNSIDENTLESLSLVVHLAEYLRKEQEGLGDSLAPYFMWVVRDFSLQMLMAET
jgi:hypothetical protein